MVCCFGVLLRGVGNSICIGLFNEVGLIVYILGIIGVSVIVWE